LLLLLLLLVVVVVLLLVAVPPLSLLLFLRRYATIGGGVRSKNFGKYVGGVCWELGAIHCNKSHAGRCLCAPHLFSLLRDKLRGEFLRQRAAGAAERVGVVTTDMRRSAVAGTTPSRSSTRTCVCVCVRAGLLP
jgi:hypothetical protein